MTPPVACVGREANPSELDGGIAQAGDSSPERSSRARRRRQTRNTRQSGYTGRVGVSFTLSFDAELDALPATRATAIGYRCGDRGTHTSRTIMLGELSQLLEAATAEAEPGDYAAAVVVDNCLAKRTASKAAGRTRPPAGRR